MTKDYKKIAYDELLEKLKVDLKDLQEEKERLEVEYEKLNAEMVLFKRIMRTNEKYRPKYDETRQKYNDFNFEDIDGKLQEAQTLVQTLEDIIRSEF